MEKEFKGTVLNGFLMLFVTLLLCFGGLALIIIAGAELFPAIIPMWMVSLGIVAFIASFFLMPGFVMLEPNEARVMVFFGKYDGTFMRTGYFWVNPFMSKKAVSLRARNLNVDPIKVNDKEGNPIMIGLVLVWKLNDSYKAMFEIDSQTLAASAAAASGQVATSQVASRMRAFENFVKVQSDAGENLGVLDDVLQTGANDVYVFTKMGEADLLVPKIPDCVKEIDLEKGTVLVHLLPGLRD